MCFGGDRSGDSGAEAAAAEASRRADEALSYSRKAADDTKAALATRQDSEPARRAQEAALRKLSAGGAYSRNFVKPAGDENIAYKMLFGA
jgi:hypothetical protein